MNPNLDIGFDTNDTNTTPLTTSKIEDGFAIEELVTSAVHNEMFKQLFAATNKSKIDGVWDWETALEYRNGALVWYSDTLWQSLAGTNQGNTPVAGAFWKDIAGIQFGIGQSQQDVKASRFVGVTYTNNTGKAIEVSVTIQDISTTGSATLSFYINNAIVATSKDTNGNTATTSIGKIVLDGDTYKIDGLSGGDTILYWSEIR